MLGTLFAHFEGDRRTPEDTTERDRQASLTAELIWDRASFLEDPTESADETAQQMPSEKECIQAIETLATLGGGLKGSDIELLWHSPRFRSIRPQLQERGLDGIERHFQNSQKAYSAFVEKYGDSDAKKLLPFILDWQEKVFQHTGEFAGRVEITPEMLSDPKHALRRASKDSPHKKSLQSQWRLDIMTRALRGEWSKDQLQHIWNAASERHQAIKNEYPHQRISAPPMIVGIHSVEEFIEKYSKR